jgi:hypothetical protein
MRVVQTVILALGVLSFLALVAFIGQGTGDTLWRAGVAAMLVVLACARLWPSAKTA